MIRIKCGLKKDPSEFAKTPENNVCKECRNLDARIRRSSKPRIEPHRKRHGGYRSKKKLTPEQEKERIEDQRVYAIGARILGI